MPNTAHGMSVALASAATMQRARKLTVISVLALISGGSAFDIAFSVEHWPLSPYEMFSDPRRDYELTAARLFGVPKDRDARELSLSSREQIFPFDRARLNGALEILHRNCCSQRPVLRCGEPGLSEGERALCAAMAATWSRYRALRKSGRHDGPELEGVRLYRLHWHLRADAANVDEPDEARLLAEYFFDGGDSLDR